MTFDDQLKALDRKFRNALKIAVEDCSEVLSDEILKRCPVDTGNLKDSIGIEPVNTSSKLLSCDVSIGKGKDVDYEIEVEYGTHNDPANPFIRPAENQTRRRRIDVIEDATRNALRQS